MKEKKKYYMLVTPDEYELPLMVAESISELTKYDGTSASNLSCKLSRHHSGVRTGFRVVCVMEE